MNVFSKEYELNFTLINRYDDSSEGVRGVMVIIVGNGHGDTSSNPGRDLLHFK